MAKLISTVITQGVGEASTFSVPASGVYRYALQITLGCKMKSDNQKSFHYHSLGPQDYYKQQQKKPKQ